MEKTKNKTEKKPWEPSIYQCPNCRKLLFSKHPGHFAGCKCGNAVDQTKHYTRCIGNVKLVQRGASESEDQ